MRRDGWGGSALCWAEAGSVLNAGGLSSATASADLCAGVAFAGGSTHSRGAFGAGSDEWGVSGDSAQAAEPSATQTIAAAPPSPYSICHPFFGSLVLPPIDSRENRFSGVWFPGAAD